MSKVQVQSNNVIDLKIDKNDIIDALKDKEQERLSGLIENMQKDIDVISNNVKDTINSIELRWKDKAVKDIMASFPSFAKKQLSENMFINNGYSHGLGSFHNIDRCFEVMNADKHIQSYNVDNLSTLKRIKPALRNNKITLPRIKEVRLIKNDISVTSRITNNDIKISIDTNFKVSEDEELKMLLKDLVTHVNVETKLRAKKIELEVEELLVANGESSIKSDVVRKIMQNEKELNKLLLSE